MHPSQHLQPEGPFDRLLALIFQVTLASNFFGPVYLTSLLLDVLKASAPSRIVYEASMLEQWGSVDWNDLG